MPICGIEYSSVLGLLVTQDVSIVQLAMEGTLLIHTLKQARMYTHITWVIYTCMYGSMTACLCCM